jgi:C1A family cysteine protease
MSALPTRWKVSEHYLPNDAAAIAAAVQANGAVIATIQVLSDFLLYTDGVYDQVLCTGATLSHAVLIVGFGTEPADTGSGSGAAAARDYWLVKNSFGRAWGEGGYFRIARGKNMCGIEKNWPLALSLLQ